MLDGRDRKGVAFAVICGTEEGLPLDELLADLSLAKFTQEAIQGFETNSEKVTLQPFFVSNPAILIMSRDPSPKLIRLSEGLSSSFDSPSIFPNKLSN